MLNPKILYRQMDSFLAQVAAKESDTNFMSSVIGELEGNLGKMLHFGKGRLYESQGDHFQVLYAHPDIDNGLTNLPLSSKNVRRLLRYGSYILEFPSAAQADPTLMLSTGAPVAGFSLHGPRRLWLAAFDLFDDWNRDEVLFCFNALRAALNQRLLADNLTDEIEQAARVQNSLIPQSAPLFPGYEIAARSEPARVVGGDFYDYYSPDDGNVGFVIGDASGKGLPAALLVRDVVTGMRLGMSSGIEAVRLLKTLNQVIQHNTYSTRFISLFYAELGKNGRLQYINCGHPPPFILTSQNRAIELDATGTILGALHDISVSSSVTLLEPGDILVAYSDGIIESPNDCGESFGIERLQALVGDNRQESAGDIETLIFETVTRFNGGTKWRDDATCLILKKVH